MVLTAAERMRRYRAGLSPAERERVLAAERVRGRAEYAALTVEERRARNAAHGKRGRCSGCGELVWWKPGKSRPDPVCRACQAARMTRVCRGCGEPFRAKAQGGGRVQQWCSWACRFPPGQRRRGNPPGWTVAAGYGGAHDRLRAEALAALVPGAPCPQTFLDGSRCGLPMWAGDELDLGHTADRAGYLGLVHAACNRRDGAHRANGKIGRAAGLRAELAAAAEAKRLARALRVERDALAADARAVREAARRERAAAAYALRCDGAKWREIAAALGFKDTGCAWVAAAAVGPLPVIAGRQGRRRAA